MKTEQTKASSGSVGIEEFRNKLRLRLPCAIAGSKNRYISTGLQATPENWKEAQIKAWEIEEDISTGHFDPTLAKYKPRTHLTLIKPVDKPQQTLTLDELWERYTEYKSKLIEVTTIKATYKRVKNLIALFSSRDLKDAVVIRDWLLANKSLYTAKFALIHLSGCCEWAVESNLIESNPFAKMAQQIKESNIQETDGDGEDIDPFTAQERDAIIEAFENSRYYKHYIFGGDGKDTFVLYYSTGGIDTISDFLPGQDVLSITTAPQSLMSSSSNSVNPVSIQNAFLGKAIGGTITLSGIFTYYIGTGALLYGSQQIAWLPPNLFLTEGDIHQYPLE